MSDTLLDLDVGPEDGLYRLCRDQSGVRKIIYVHVIDINLLPEESQTSQDELLRELRRLEGWCSEWDTLTVSLTTEGLRGLINAYKPHTLPATSIPGEYPFFNILDLCVVSHRKTRVKCVEIGSRPCYMKIARFQFEIPQLQQEIQAYHALQRHKSSIAPNIIGYVYEGTKDRVIGFLMEALSGKRAGIEDLTSCEQVLRQLHSLDIIHGDIVRDNFLVTRSGVKLIDFENSCLGPEGSAEDWARRKEEELTTLTVALSDESNRGRPWAA